MAPVQHLVTQAEPLHGAGPEILEEHVHAVDQPQTQVKTSRMLEIDRDSPFAPVQAKKEAGHASGKWRAPAAAHVSRPGLELVHFGPVVGQKQGAIRPRQRVRKIEHSDAFERRPGRLPIIP